MDGGAVRTPHWGCHSYASARLVTKCVIIIMRLSVPSLSMQTDFDAK